jgi:hypothetical protein
VADALPYRIVTAFPINNDLEKEPLLPKDVTEFDAYIEVKKFVAERVTPHFADARELLKLEGFNFIIAGDLCSAASGLSTTLYKPSHAITRADRNGVAHSYYMDGVEQKALGTRKLFIDMLTNYYPWEAGEIGADKAQEIYELIRCPFSHRLGEDAMPGLDVRVVKGKGEPPRQGWAEIELMEIETEAFRPFGLPQAWTGGWPNFVFRVESFYRGLYGLLKNLAKDTAQMADAEKRFGGGEMVWHKP